MVDALRAALRLLPAVRPSVGGACGTCSRVPKARIHSAPDQSALLAFKVHPQIVNLEKAPQGGTGIVRFARAVLAYVGAGLSAVTANQLAGPSSLQAKELGSTVGGDCTRSATETSGMWQRASANCHLVHEDAIRSTKLAHCPLPHAVSKAQDDPSHSVGHSYYWSNSWGSVDARVSPDAKLDLQWQFSPSAHREYRSKLGGLDDTVNSRFSKPTGLQALAAESNSSVKSHRGLTCTVSDYNTASELDLELEWQLIVDPQPKSGTAASSDNKLCEEDEEVSIQEALKADGQKDEHFHKPQVKSWDVGTSEILTKSNREVVVLGSHHGSGLDKQQAVASMRESPIKQCSDHQDKNSNSSSKKSLLSYRTEKENFSAMFAQKGVARLENCDLPTPQTRSMERLEIPARQARFTSTMSLAGVDISSSVEKKGDMSWSLDKNLLASLLRGNEPTRLENSDLPSSAFVSGRPDPTKVGSVHLHHQAISQPQDIPSTLVPPSTRCGSHSFSADSRNTSWNGGGASRSGTNRSSGLLGEALCHSQTRAREAEKKVREAHEEKEKLLRLFFREASLSLTYRQWVTSLQAENTWLRMYARSEPLAWMHHNILSPFSAMECLSRTGRWKNLGQDYAVLQIEHNISAMNQDKNSVGARDSNEIMMGCTLGLAFALGLSLAGAGLMISWSMGWIFLACSVSM